jgi:hypothetical protein
VSQRESEALRNFDKLIDEGMLDLQGKEADEKYLDLWEKVKRMQKL